jgi:hypothetical protein
VTAASPWPCVAPLFDESEVVGRQTLPTLEFACHHWDRHSAVLVPIVIREDERALDLVVAEPLYALEEAIAPIVPPQFAIRDRLKTNSLLHGNRFVNGFVFQGAQHAFRQFALEIGRVCLH